MSRRSFSFQVQDGPAILPGDTLEGRLWIHCGGMTDHGQHWDIRGIVGKSKGAGEIDVVLFGIFANPDRLGRSGQNRRPEFSGSHPPLENQPIGCHGLNTAIDWKTRLRSTSSR